MAFKHILSQFKGFLFSARQFPYYHTLKGKTVNENKRERQTLALDATIVGAAVVGGMVFNLDTGLAGFVSGFRFKRLSGW
jgi:hypothetical protein